MTTQSPQETGTEQAATPARGRVRRWLFTDDWMRSLALGIIAAVGLVGSFPPFGLWVLVILPVWASIRAADPVPGNNKTSSRPSGLWFAIGTIPAWAWLTRWAAQGALAGFPLMVLYLAAFSGIGVWAIARVRRRFPRLPGIVAIPIGWVGVEAFRGLLAFDGFPWFLVEHPLIDATLGGVPVLAGPAAIGGVWLVGLFLSLHALLIDRALQAAHATKWWLGALGSLIAWIVVGALVVPVESPATERRPSVAIIQTDVPQSVKTGWSFDDRWRDWLALRGMLLAAGLPDDEGRTPDFIVIPETMFPGMVLGADAAKIERENDVAWIFEPVPISEGGTGESTAIRAETVRDQLLEVSARIGDIPIFVGAIRYEGFRIDRDGDLMNYAHNARFNSVFVLNKGRILDTTYDKQHLTPFGEVMPYISRWPALERALLSLGASGMSFDLDSGTRRTVFAVETPGSVAEPVRVVAPICYEATVGGVCRSLVYERGERAADVLLNLTNDGWFYDAAGGREAHLLMARWRCLELATPMVRAANTGVSAVVGVDGEILASIDDREAGVLIAALPEAVDPTPYARIGDLVGWICLIGAIFGVAASYLPMQTGDQPQ